MVGDVQNVAADYERGMLAPPANYHAAVERRERGIAGAGGRVAGFYQDSAQPAIALAGFGAVAFATAFVVARRHSGPAVQISGAGKPAHIGADLCQDSSRRDLLDARNAAQML